MKNLTTILTELGIEVPEEKKSELEKQLGENYKPVSEVEKVRAARDNYKTQLDTAQETLKSFEGVDVNELQGKISTLQNDLAAQKTAFEQQISDMEFNSMLEDAIGKAGARSVKPAREKQMVYSDSRNTDGVRPYCGAAYSALREFQSTHP